MNFKFPVDSDQLHSPTRMRLSVALILGMLISLVSACAQSTEGNLLGNPDFEQAGEGFPAEWIIVDEVKHKGSVEIINNRDGGKRVSIKPNAKNIAAELESDPMGIGQAFNLLTNPSLRGETLYVSARMGASGEATARVRVIAIRLGEFLGTSMEQGDSGGELVELSGKITIPDDLSTLYVVIGLDALGTSGEVSFDDVYLGLEPKNAKALKTQDNKPVSMAQIHIDAGKTIRTIPETLYGVNLEWGWDGNGLWNADKAQLDTDIVKLTRDLRPSTMRFPGGLFADFYHWKDGIGLHKQRPTTAHFPEGPESKHNLGTDEALEFASRSGSELMITVNIATGTPEEAVDWLRYVNRPGKTKGKPPKVKYWEIGNENYYYSETPYLKQAAHNGKQYARRVQAFAKALKKADPRIKIIAIAEENFYSDFEPVHHDWMQLLLTKASSKIDYIAIHNGYVPGLAKDYDLDLRSVYRAMLAAPIQLRKSLDRVSAQIKKYAPEHASRIKIAVTEWSPSFQIALDGPYLDHPKTLGSALFVASNIKNYIEHPDVDIANYFKLNDYLWSGMLAPRKGKFIGTAPYYAFRMYRQHFGQTLVRTRTESPTYDTAGAGHVSGHKNVPYLDVVSSLSKDGKRLYIMVINKHFEQDIKARLKITGFKVGSAGRAFVLSGSGIDANTGTELFTAPGMKWPKQTTDEKNPRFTKGGPKEIKISEHPVQVASDGFEYQFGKHSITAIELDLDGL